MDRTVGFKFGFSHAPSARVKLNFILIWARSKIRIAGARVGFNAANRESFPPRMFGRIPVYGISPISQNFEFAVLKQIPLSLQLQLVWTLPAHMK